METKKILVCECVLIADGIAAEISTISINNSFETLVSFKAVRNSQFFTESYLRIYSNIKEAENNHFAIRNLLVNLRTKVTILDEIVNHLEFQEKFIKSGTSRVAEGIAEINYLRNRLLVSFIALFILPLIFSFYFSPPAFLDIVFATGELLGVMYLVSWLINSTIISTVHEIIYS